MKLLTPKPGFNFQRICWSRPDSPRPVLCSYCFAGIPEDSVPLMVFAQDGHLAQFCDVCAEQWWTMAEVED